MKLVSFSSTVFDPVGLHARPLAILVTIASKFKSNVSIESAGRVGNLKSIMNTLALAIKCGDEFTIKVDGSDEEQCLADLTKSLKEHKIIKT